MRKCAICKQIKDVSLFYTFYTCRKCKTIEDIEEFILLAKISNHLNISIEEVKNILTININDSGRNEFGEHNRFDELMLLITGFDENFSSSSIIIYKERISNFLDE